MGQNIHILDGKWNDKAHFKGKCLFCSQFHISSSSKAVTAETPIGQESVDRS